MILKVDKGNTFIIFDNNTSEEIMHDLLRDTSKFKKIDVPAGKELNHVINVGLRVQGVIVKLLKAN